MNTRNIRRSAASLLAVRIERSYVLCGLLCLVAVFAFAGAFAVFNDASHSGEPSISVAAPPLPVVVTTAEKSDSYLVTQSFTGILKTAQASQLGFEAPGTIVELTARQGQRVEQGELLGRLDTRRLYARIARIKAERKQAEAVLAELRAGPRRETIAAAESAVRQLQAEVDLQEANHARRQTLAGERLVSQAMLDEALYGSRAARARLEAAKRQLQQLQAGTRPEKIAAQVAATHSLDAALADVTIQLDGAKIVAPFSGTIAQRYVDKGTVVAGGTPVYRLVDDRNLEAWFGLPAEAAAEIALGDTYKVQVAGKDYTTTAAAKLPELDSATRTRTVIFKFSTISPELVPSQLTRLLLARRQDAQGYWLPTSSLVRGVRGLWSVLAVETKPGGNVGCAARRDVEVLLTRGDQSFVRGTIVAGEKIVADGVHRLVNGQLVAVGSE